MWLAGWLFGLSLRLALLALALLGAADVWHTITSAVV